MNRETPERIAAERARENLRVAARARGYEPSRMAAALHPDYDQPVRRYARLLTGHTRMTLDDVERLARVLRCPPGVLAFGTRAEVEAALHPGRARGTRCEVEATP